METTRQCCTIGGCPFAYTEESEYIQNTGCLPSPMAILSMRVHFGKTWACHSNPDKPCLGALRRLKELGFEHKVIDENLLTESDDWGKFITSDAYAFITDVNNRDMERIKNGNFQIQEFNTI